MKQPINPKFSVFKELLNAKDTPFEQSLTEIYNRIKVGNKILIDKIDKIRNTATDKEEKEATKKQLYCICFNGIFTQRSKVGLTQHSGLCILDFDDFESEEQYNLEFEVCKQVLFHGMQILFLALFL